MGRRAKAWIKGTRVVQLVLRIIEHIANIGLLILMILINNVEPLTGWVLRVTVSLVADLDERMLRLTPPRSPLLLFTVLMESIITLDRQADGLQGPRPPTMCSPVSLILPSCRSMLMAAFQPATRLEVALIRNGELCSTTRTPSPASFQPYTMV